MSNIFPTFEPYWLKVKSKLDASKWWLSHVSVYGRIAIAANVVGIAGLAYLMLRLTFPELWYTPQEQIDKGVPNSGELASFDLGITYLFWLGVSFSLLLISLSPNKPRKKAALLSLSIVLGLCISTWVINEIFF